jgi:anti-anti-sigma regulatory factor
MAPEFLPSTDGERRARSLLTTSEVPAQLIDLRSEWDLAIRPDLAPVLARAMRGDGDVIIDMAEADVIDTAAYFTLAATARLLHDEGRRMIFRSPSQLAIRVLDLYGLSHLIDPL